MFDLKHLRSNTSRMSNIESNNSQKDTPSKSLKSFSVSEALVQFSSSTTTLRGQRKNFFFQRPARWLPRRRYHRHQGGRRVVGRDDLAKLCCWFGKPLLHKDAFKQSFVQWHFVFTFAQYNFCTNT